MKILTKKVSVMNYRILTFFILFIFAYEYTVSQEYSETIHETRSYKVSAVTTVDITNKYGKIHIHPWDKDSVRFKIEVIVEADTRSKFEKLKEGIDFQFTGTEYYVMAKTEVGSKYTSLLDELKGLTKVILI
jgi:serine protease inhibitor